MKLGRSQGFKLSGLLLTFLLLCRISNASTNSSGLTVANDSTHGGLTSICSGKLEPQANLHEIGVSEARLKEGTVCVPGDFDGNGYLDFAFWSDLMANEHRRIFKVLFFDKSGVSRTQVLGEAFKDHLFTSISSIRNQSF